MFSLIFLAFAVTACSANPFQRIIGGSPADISDYQYQLSLQGNNRHICGAVYYSKNIALTAAHCVNSGNPSSYTIVGGISDLRTSNARAGVTKITQHPYYIHGSNYPNDIAILHLDRDLTGYDNIKPIDIATTEQAHQQYQNCKITGWGLTDGLIQTNQLQMAETTVISTSDCLRHWSQVENSLHVCLFTRQTGACMGDSGGPLVCEVNGKPELVGLTSWGSSSCSTRYPSVYTRVSTHRDWIQDTAGPQTN